MNKLLKILFEVIGVHGCDHVYW